MTVVRAHLSGGFAARTNSAVCVLLNVVRSEDVRGLYRGFAVTLCGTVPFEGIRIGAYALLRGWLPVMHTNYGTTKRRTVARCLALQQPQRDPHQTRHPRRRTQCSLAKRPVCAECT